MLSMLERARIPSSLLFIALAVACSSEEDPKKEPELPACPDDKTTAPAELRCTGLYANWSKKTVAADVTLYKPGLELWSDGAEKSRYFSIPKGTKIDTSNSDDWPFPVGTKTWKEFRVDGKKIETRLYWKVSDTQWVWTTYRWLPDESRADRLDTGRANAQGDYEIPTTQTCDQCHRGRKDKLLGIEAVALSQPDAQGLTLAKLKADGMLSTDVAATVIPEDATGKAKAALGYLHMNCGVSCHDSASHSPGVQSGLFFKLRTAELATGSVTELSAFKTSVDQPIVGNQYFDYTSKGFLRIKRGDANTSLVHELAKQRATSIQMPPIATHKADFDGLARIEGWIRALPPK